ncbi:Hpt domain-containing protein [Aquimarina sp. D1M17]|uniref:Hpt domain-containing protein n=1 Tax=Aquimarina acroporae TaxID=2937283 RepID=UPI0020C17270|nr:Hpt domain-containing protein [Aquimarina acroporae]MCK8520151.1 Hpt domain-containing protein [Aquimarina acroporae]
MERPNLTEIRKLSGGDPVFEEKIFSVIKKEFPVEKENYFVNLASGNNTKAAEDVHKLKHKIGFLGLEQGYVVATDYENNLKENNHELKDKFENILTAITEYLQTI